MMYREGFQETVVPVVTMVLYFGTETRWNKPTNIKALMDIPRWLDPYVTDYKINVFEIAWLSEKTRSVSKRFSCYCQIFRGKEEKS